MNGFSWADESHEDSVLLDSVLPPPNDTIDAASGIRTRTEYYINEKGRRIQVIRKFKPATRQLKVNKNVERRKHITEFGDAKGQTEAIRRNVTYYAADEIRLDLSKRTDADEADDPLNKLAGSKSIVVCRLCGAVGDHWTLKCPKRDTLALPNETPSAVDSAEPASAAGASGRYIVPAQRSGARVSSTDSKDDMPTIRLTNLSEDTTESDLSELLSPFGHVTRIRLAKDRVTMRSKGYAFISFATHSSAAKAIEKLQGFGYDNLILRAEWSRSMQQLVREREEKEAQDRAASALR